METINSHSGMIHIVNKRGGGGTIPNRIQTLCRMHLKPEDAAEDDGRTCIGCTEFNEEYETETPGKWMPFYDPAVARTMNDAIERARAANA